MAGDGRRKDRKIGVAQCSNKEDQVKSPAFSRSIQEREIERERYRPSVICGSTSKLLPIPSQHLLAFTATNTCLVEGIGSAHLRLTLSIL